MNDAILAEVVMNCNSVDEEELFHQYLRKEYGKINLCGIEEKAADVLLKYDEDLYESMRKDWLAANTELVKVGYSWYRKDEVYAEAKSFVYESEKDPYDDIVAENCANLD